MKTSARAIVAGAGILIASVAGRAAHAQRGPSTHATSSTPAESATVVIAAGKRYEASAFHRWLSGSDYRDLWAMPMRVPVLDLTTFAGGLTPTKEGGGNQTKSLRFKNPNGDEWVFRLTDKHATGSPGPLKDTPLDAFLQDQVSAMHPAGAQISGPLMTATGVPHPAPRFAVMPDDSLLGKFRKEFAGKLGTIEEFPNVPEKGLGFGGASKIIDSEELLKLLDTDATQRVDARRYLAARLTDFLINDNDRHEDNWKWARLESGPKNEWEPIARDRDHAFVSYNGFLLNLARLGGPSLVTFGRVPSVDGLTQSGPIDERLLSELEKPVYDSVARAVTAEITDSVISAAVHAMPPEYRASSAKFESVLHARRDALPKAADQYYRLLAARVLVHGTDSSDRALIARSSDGVVDVRLESAGKPFYSRRFSADETSEILVYLHGGNDTAIVTGGVQRSIRVRVIGGNGANVLLDSSTVAGEANPTRIYESGDVRGVTYGPDTMFDRRPWEKVNGVLSPPRPDHGASLEPLVGLSTPQDFGLTPRLGIMRTGYGFDRRPYSSMVSLEAEYAPEFHGVNVRVNGDKRLEGSPLHFTALARMSDFQEVDYHGLGNATVDMHTPEEFYQVHQRQWLFQPAFALAIGQRMDVSLGPVIQHSVTDSARSPFLASIRPYGFGTFNQAGARATAKYDWVTVANRDEPSPRYKISAAVDGLYFPTAMDVRAPYEEVSGTLRGSTVFEMPTHPFLSVHAGAKKVFGDFPFFDAATIGGEGSMRYLEPERYAGDAAAYATSELRATLANFQFIVPLRGGVLGVAEAGRVFVHGESPAGWHTTSGEGIWIGMQKVATVVTFVHTTGAGGPSFRLTFGLN